MKNTLTLGTALFLVTATALEADDCCPPKCAQLWSSCGPDWIITPGAGPCTADGCDFFITAEFIYWAVRQDHMGFATVVPSDPTSLKPGRIIQPDWRIEPGFRVGIGWLTCIDGWDLYLNYTWLRPRTKKKTVKPSENTTLSGPINLIEGQSSQSGGLPITELTGKWDIDLNVLDFEWGRNFYISQCLHMRPHFGLKGTWKEQRYRLTGQSQLIIPIVPLNFSLESNKKIDHWGVGPRAGLDTAWHFSRCFSVIGEIAATALWGQFKTKTRTTETDLTFQQSVLLFNSFKTQWHSVKGIFEFLLGVRYEDWWCCDEYYTSFDIGWEVQWWGGQNQFTSLVLPQTRWGDLAFQGLTIRARFQF